MNIDLRKKTGINLKKGSSISLKKESKPLENICIGVNWGSIKSKLLFGLLTENTAVDLDTSLTAFNEKGEEVYTVYYRELTSSDSAIRHSGDDRVGDIGKEEDEDNEIIAIDLSQIYPDITQIVLYLTSYKKQYFHEIPYARIRIYEGTPKNMIDVISTFNIAKDASFTNSLSMIMGKLVKQNGNWSFEAIGTPVKTFRIKETLKLIKKSYI